MLHQKKRYGKSRPMKARNKKGKNIEKKNKGKNIEEKIRERENGKDKKEL